MPKNGNGDLLRSAFVEMLFALAAAEVAIFASNLVSIEAAWQEKMPALTHLAVGMILIAASWLGWSKSQSPGKLDEIESVCSIQFCGLLLDVILVILYFIVVRRVEITESDGTYLLSTPSATPESYWICVVFGVYVCWDVVTDVLSKGCVTASTWPVWIRRAPFVATVSIFTSAACFVLTFVVMMSSGEATTVWQVVLLDSALITVILFFRTFKVCENTLAPILRITDCKAFATERPTRGDEKRWNWILISAFVIFTMVGWLGPARLWQSAVSWIDEAAPSSTATIDGKLDSQLAPTE